MTEIRNRLVRVKKKGFFDLEESWCDHWWGMPEFSMGDATPGHQITMNFMTLEDLQDFAKKVGLNLTSKSNSVWWPKQDRLKPRSFFYTGPKTNSRYPVCIPSKGRFDCQTTGKILDRLGVSYNFFVEETEYDQYCENIGEDKVIRLPFHDLGKGSTPARNAIWDWAKENGHKRHWVLDDNLVKFQRCNNNRRLQVCGGGIFRAMEDFVDRYKNIAMAGPHECGFMPDRHVTPPYLWNSRVYSCILLDTSLPYRWRGKYNEDTDLSIRLLKAGYCTLLFKALLMDKPQTHSGAAEVSKGTIKGGNTDNVYNSNDHRLKFAKSLEEQHPDIVKTVWKFNRWHHLVDYSKFKKNKPILLPGITPLKCNNEYGMKLKSGDNNE